MNRVPRVYLPKAQFVDHTVRPSDEVAHYLQRVLRLRPGDRWAALDGERRSWLVEIVDDKRSHKVEEWPAVPPLSTSVEVGLALAKGSRFEDGVEKLAELGVVKVVPLETERTERGLPSSAKLQRLAGIAQASSALANRLIPLQVGSPTSLGQYLDSPGKEQMVYCHRDGSRPEQIFHPSEKSYRILIGPEGGFSPAELEAMQGKARRVSLGPLTLRVETAAVCAVSLALGLSSLPS